MPPFALTGRERAILFLLRIATALELQNTARHATGFTKDGHRSEHAHHKEEREEDDGNDEYRHKAPRPLFSTGGNLPSVTPVTEGSELPLS
jgi:hypothetical protein